MADVTYCKFFKYGYCKYTFSCRKAHVKEHCQEENNCHEVECEKRHPKDCRFYLMFGRCKFGQYCLYKHVDHESPKEIEMNKKISKIESELFAVNSYVKTLIEGQDNAAVRGPNVNDLQNENVKRIALLEQKVLDLENTVKIIDQNVIILKKEAIIQANNMDVTNGLLETHAEVVDDLLTKVSRLEKENDSLKLQQVTPRTYGNVSALESSTPMPPTPPSTTRKKKPSKP